ncbi:unnamed protein product [Ambrosiozyma monospora]|uniref:Unnamed protein product n=1 Tax=Ambrosiozyma monospora TaxID=43982 RepID=A0ACB5THU8_AMBMO|nr:unnamed protein product [Ambrosiozyma monospora]
MDSSDSDQQPVRRISVRSTPSTRVPAPSTPQSHEAQNNSYIHDNQSLPRTPLGEHVDKEKMVRRISVKSSPSIYNNNAIFNFDGHSNDIGNVDHDYDNTDDVPPAILH